MLRCWKLLLPHFKVAGCTKYSLEALKLQIHSGIEYSPNLAHQVMWNRFVNVRGGAGNNIPCDQEHGLQPHRVGPSESTSKCHNSSPDMRDI